MQFSISKTHASVKEYTFEQRNILYKVMKDTMPFGCNAVYSGKGVGGNRFL